MKDSIGDRMKANYEDRGRHYLIRRMPVVIRVDGKAFHSFTRGLNRPYDTNLADCMTLAALRVAAEMQGFKIGYVQSDEASFVLTDYDTLDTQGWFDYNKSKMETIAASTMTAHFNLAASERLKDNGLAVFDGRAFNLPREEVSNYLLWRAIDWRRNSIAMTAQAHFSPKRLHGKGRVDQLEMLKEIGVDWQSETPEPFKCGTFIIRSESSGITLLRGVEPTFLAIDKIVTAATAPKESESK